jgi:hypothetical protein
MLEVYYVQKHAKFKLLIDFMSLNFRFLSEALNPSVPVANVEPSPALSSLEITAYVCVSYKC